MIKWQKYNFYSSISQEFLRFRLAFSSSGLRCAQSRNTKTFACPVTGRTLGLILLSGPKTFGHRVCAMIRAKYSSEIQLEIHPFAVSPTERDGLFFSVWRVLKKKTKNDVYLIKTIIYTILYSVHHSACTTRLTVTSNWRRLCDVV